MLPRRAGSGQCRLRSTASRSQSDKKEKGTLQRFLSQSAAKVPRLGAADGGGKSPGGEGAAGCSRRRAEKGHRPRQETGCGEKGALAGGLSVVTGVKRASDCWPFRFGAPGRI